jgi:hypothetical protein
MGRPRIGGVTELTNKIILAFAEGGVVRRNAYWFQPDIAIQIIQRAKETRTAVFGFYAATIGRYDVYESLENSWNYVAALPPVQNPHEHAIQFISKHKESGLRFAINLSEHMGGVSRA